MTVASKGIYLGEDEESAKLTEREKERRRERKEKRKDENDQSQIESEQLRIDNIQRARSKARDIALINEWDYFITLTLDRQKIDRYDREKIGKALGIWLSNMVQRKKIRYLIIPELHGDGAIHFHGLIGGGEYLNLKDSGKKTTRGQKIYNLENWKYGFSTCIETYGEVGSIGNYIIKYITKDSKKILGKYYRAGGENLERDVPYITFSVDYEKAKELFKLQPYEVERIQTEFIGMWSLELEPLIEKIYEVLL